MDKVADVAYAPEHGIRGTGDISLPDRPDRAPAALVIHGGGWQAMDKQGLAGVAELLAERGWGAFAINYRLLGQAPWPACGDDCLRAAGFLLEGGHAALRPLDRASILIVGSSAGGHLTLMTGLRLPAANVKAMVSLAGPADLELSARQKGGVRYPKLFGVSQPSEVTAEMLRAASPINYVTPQAPRLLCIQSLNDELVRPDQSEAICARYREVDASAELFTFAGLGDGHGIWDPATSNPRRLLPEPAGALTRFVEKLT